MMLMRYFLFIFAMFFLIFPVSAQVVDTGINFKLGYETPDPANPGKMLPYQPPVEPNIPPVKFLVQEPSTSLKDNVDRLLQGIKVDLPPQYDLYGYEIRRYMAHIGGPDVYSNEERLREELKNIRRAKIVFEYWRKDIMKKNDDIRARIEAENPGSDVRTSFNYNSGVVAAFLTECQSWIDRNEELLEFLLARQGMYSYKSPALIFQYTEDLNAFSVKYDAAQKAKKYITEYPTFSMMVY
jgi:hypothetical protein